MRHFMKFMCVILVFIMMLCLSACSDSNEGTTDPAETTLPTTQPSEPAQTTAPQQTPSGYVVNVVDENGSPIVGAVVQLCKVIAILPPPMPMAVLFLNWQRTTIRYLSLLCLRAIPTAAMSRNSILKRVPVK